MSPLVARVVTAMLRCEFVLLSSRESREFRDFSERRFGKGMSTENFLFLESGDSLNGRNLFTELPFL